MTASTCALPARPTPFQHRGRRTRARAPATRASIQTQSATAATACLALLAPSSRRRAPGRAALAREAACPTLPAPLATVTSTPTAIRPLARATSAHPTLPARPDTFGPVRLHPRVCPCMRVRVPAKRAMPARSCMPVHSCEVCMEHMDMCHNALSARALIHGDERVAGASRPRSLRPRSRHRALGLWQRLAYGGGLLLFAASAAVCAVC